MNARALKILRATKLLPLLLLLSLPPVAQAQYYYTNGLDIWSYSPNPSPVTITGYRGPGGALVVPSVINGSPVTGIGFTAFYANTSLTSIAIPDSVTSIGDYAFEYCTSLSSISIGNGVTSIGDFAFAGGSSLTSITIPDSVTSIGQATFEDCANVTDVTIGHSVTSIGASAFQDCNGLTSIAIPDSVTSLGDYSFANCTNLTGITLGNHLASIGDYAFDGCSSLGSIAIPDSMTSIGMWAFGNCTTLTGVTIGNGGTSIEDFAFGECSGLTSVTMGNGVTSIGEGTFYQCSSLSSIAIPDSTTNLGDMAFYGCSSVANATIGNGVTSLEDNVFYECFNMTNVTTAGSVTRIGDDAFFLCESLSGITIPGSVTNIGDEAFIYCDGLTNMFIPAGVTSIGDAAFFECFSLPAIDVDAGNQNYSSVDGVLFDKNQNTLIQCPCGKERDYVIPQSVTNIETEAFYECYLLTTVTIPSSVTSIADFTFPYCSSLENVIIPDSVTSIGQQAFRFCEDLTNVNLGSGVTSIGLNAFSDCASLATVYFKGNSPTPTNDLSVFQNDTTGTVYYQPSTTGWGTLFDGWPAMPNVATSGVGSVDQIVGNVTVTHPDGSTTTLQVGDPVQMGDIVNTPAGGMVHIVFLDNTSLALAENAKLTIDEYVYDPGSKAGSSSVGILRGTFDYVSGLIGPNNPGEENLKTAYGVLGIRGTHFIVRQDSCSSTQMVYLIQGELAITPLDTPGVTNICDGPVTIYVTTSSVTTSALDQTTFNSVSNQVFQSTGVVTFGSWVEQYFDCTNDPDAAPTADPSGDGEDNYSKFLAGMNPTNKASYFHILSATHQGNDELVTWMCGGGRTNVLQTATNLVGSWSSISPNIVLSGSGDSITSYLDVGALTNASSRFYRVQLVQ